MDSSYNMYRAPSGREEVNPASYGGGQDEGEHQEELQKPLQAPMGVLVLVLVVGKGAAALFWVSFILFWAHAAALLSPMGVNFEVQALMGIKASLNGPHSVLQNWDLDSVDPCSWAMVTCSPENLVNGLGTPSQNLSGTLSPSIGNLTNLQIVLLQNNISEPIPQDIGRLAQLQTLDLSNNHFTGVIPPSLGHLQTLEYLRLNNNSLSGPFPLSLANITQLAFLDLYNNLRGPIARFPARTFNIVGNPLICACGSEKECYGTVPMPISFNLNDSQDEAKQLADEVRDSMRNVLGVDRFVSQSITPSERTSRRGDKRRTEQKLIAVINPMRHAKRKLRTAEKHRAHKKRKLAAMKIGRWRR